MRAILIRINKIYGRARRDSIIANLNYDRIYCRVCASGENPSRPGFVRRNVIPVGGMGGRGMCVHCGFLVYYRD